MVRKERLKRAPDPGGSMEGFGPFFDLSAE